MRSDYMESSRRSCEPTECEKGIGFGIAWGRFRPRILKTGGQRIGGNLGYMRLSGAEHFLI